MSAPVAWQGSSNLWHQVVLTWSYSPEMPTRLYVDGALADEGEPVALVALEPSPGLFGFCVGSDVRGEGRVAQVDELLILGSPKTGEEIAARYRAEATLSARGPISAAEDEAWQQKLAAVRAEREAAAKAGAAGEMTLLSVSCGTNGAVYITNLTSNRTTNAGATVSFDVAGSTNDPFHIYDVYRTDNLAGSNIADSAWVWLGRAHACDHREFTNEPSAAFYVLGEPLDEDADLLPSAYELLVSKMPTNNYSAPDTDADGMLDAWELVNGTNPSVNDAAGDADGDGISNLQEYLNEQQLLRPREPLGPCSRRTPLVISEIRYQPQTDQFIEIYNSSHLPIDLRGYTIASPSFAHVFPTNTPPLGTQQFLAVGLTNQVVANHDRIRLFNNSGALLLEIEYSAEEGWPLPWAGAGHSMVLARPSLGENNPRAWAPSESMGGSRGTDEPQPGMLRAVVINEFMADPPPGNNDWIELHNRSAVAIDISGWYLSDRSNDLARYPIPSPTFIPPHGFVVLDQFGSYFGLTGAGEAIYLTDPTGHRVIDAVWFGGQGSNVTSGRFPDGAGGFQPLSSPTPGATNTLPLASDVVINEIMFHPLSGNNRHEYVELYNRGTNAVSIGDWQLVGIGGAVFRIPSPRWLEPNGFLVVAKDVTALLARYPGVLSSNNTVGNYDGSLANSGEHFALLRPTATNSGRWMLADEVTYGDGGRWGQWADGGGSSLELIDPRSDNRLAANWADSDETAKGAWTNVTLTGLMDHAAPGTSNTTAFQLLSLGSGEYAVDDVDVRRTGGANLIYNGSFNSGMAGWVPYGNHVQTDHLTNGGLNGTGGLRLRASGRGEPIANRVDGLFAAGTSLTNGSTATQSVWARWRRGWAQLLGRLAGNWLESVLDLPLPHNLGTPGQGSVPQNRMFPR